VLNLNKHIEHWRSEAKETLDTADDLMRSRRFGFALFAAHLALEKATKALVCRATREVPPKLHNLIRLLELAEVIAPQETLDFLTTMNEFNQIGRYTEFGRVKPTKAEAENLITKTKEIFDWLIKQ
jgi:HEPN domain-containing protein